MIHIRVLEQKDWPSFKEMRLEALRLHENFYFSSYESEKTKSDDYWQDILVHDNKRVFGLFDGNSLIGIGAVFTDREDSSKKTAVLAMGAYPAGLSWSKTIPSSLSITN